jgi:hypothetical protein
MIPWIWKIGRAGVGAWMAFSIFDGCHSEDGRRDSRDRALKYFVLLTFATSVKV